MCDQTPPAALTLPLNDRAPGSARQFLDRVHCPTHQAATLDEAHLLVTELVTNAVRHAGPPLTVEVSCDGTTAIIVRVSDGSPATPVRRTPDLDEESGRGVALVDLLSDQWGVEPTPHGKRVWFRLRPSAA